MSENQQYSGGRRRMWYWFAAALLPSCLVLISALILGNNWLISSRLTSQGEHYFATAQYGQAIDAYSQALRWRPGNLTALFQRGRAYAKSGDIAAAYADYNRCIQLTAPDRQVVLQWLQQLGLPKPADHPLRSRCTMEAVFLDR